MRSKGHRHKLHVMLVVLTLGLTFIGSPTTWAGPYLRTSTEMSIARSTKECGGQARRALSSLQKKGHLRVGRKSKYYGVTKASTLKVECLFVGPNEQRRDQWIFHISIASTNSKESGKLLKLLRRELSKFVRID